MNCQKCGNQINPGDVNCGICGTPVAQPVQNVNNEVPTAAPVATLEPVMEEVSSVAPVAQPAPVADVPEALPVVSDVEFSEPIPVAPVATTPVMPAPVQEVAQPVVTPVQEVAPVAQPAPVAQVTPAVQPVPVAQPAPVAQPSPAPVAQPASAPVAQPVSAQPVAVAAPVAQPMPVAPKKNNTIFIIIIVLLVAAICAVGYMLVTDNNPFASDNAKTSEKENKKDTDKKDDEEKDEEKEDKDEEDDDDKIVNVDTFDYSGYKFKKLDSYQYALQNNVFLVKSNNTTITYYNLVHPYAYANYTSQPDTLKTYFEQSGYYTNVQYGEATYEGRSILIFTSNESVIFFTKLSDYLTIQTEIVSIGTAANVDQVYAELNEIANSYDSTSMANAAEGEFKFEYTKPNYEEEKNLGTIEFIKK